MRPFRIQICGQPFSVDWDDSTEADLEGDEAEIITSKQQIVMHSKDMAPHHQRVIVLHEILHGIIQLTAQEDRFVPKGDEPIVDAMSVALLDLLRSNPHLVDWLMESLP